VHKSMSVQFQRDLVLLLTLPAAVTDNCGANEIQVYCGLDVDARIIADMTAGYI